MATLEELGEVVAADLLIVGGGVGGLAAAIKAKEAAPNIDVLMVEKQTVGFAGKATKIGGILAFLAPGNNADKFIEFQVRTVGEFLNDQEALTKYVGDTYPAIEQLGKWGAKFAKQLPVSVRSLFLKLASSGTDAQKLVDSLLEES